MTRRVSRYLTFVLLISVPALVCAVTVVQCRDQDGNVSFRDRCPPNIAKTGERRVTNKPAHDGRPSATDLQKQNPIILYSASECDTCDLVRLRLQGKAVPFKEIDVSTDLARQKKLKQVSGALTVPTVMIGKNVLTGYNQLALDTGLEQAGYSSAAKNPAKGK